MTNRVNYERTFAFRNNGTTVIKAGTAVKVADYVEGITTVAPGNGNTYIGVAMYDIPAKPSDTDRKRPKHLNWTARSVVTCPGEIVSVRLQSGVGCSAGKPLTANASGLWAETSGTDIFAYAMETVTAQTNKVLYASAILVRRKFVNSVGITNSPASPAAFEPSVGDTTGSSDAAPAATGGVGTLTYSLATEIPDWAEFNATTRKLSIKTGGTVALLASTPINVRATDTIGQTAVGHWFTILVDS